MVGGREAGRVRGFGKLRGRRVCTWPGIACACARCFMPPDVSRSAIRQPNPCARRIGPSFSSLSSHCRCAHPRCTLQAACLAHTASRCACPATALVLCNRHRQWPPPVPAKQGNHVTAASPRFARLRYLTPSSSSSQGQPHYGPTHKPYYCVVGPGRCHIVLPLFFPPQRAS